MQIPAERVTKSGDKDKESSVYIAFLHHPYCYLDILYVHKRTNEEGVKCQEIFNLLRLLACRPYSHSTAGQITNLNQFVLETHASTIKLSSHMASLMAHPAQRDEVHDGPTLPLTKT